MISLPKTGTILKSSVLFTNPVHTVGLNNTEKKREYVLDYGYSRHTCLSVGADELELEDGEHDCR